MAGRLRLQILVEDQRGQPEPQRRKLTGRDQLTNVSAGRRSAGGKWMLTVAYRRRPARIDRHLGLIATASTTFEPAYTR
jgi:hypothetical protein